MVVELEWFSLLQRNKLNSQGSLLTDAFEAGAVEDVAHGALAAERTVRIDAITAVTNAGHGPALVEVFALGSTSRPARAQLAEFLCFNCKHG